MRHLSLLLIILIISVTFFLVSQKETGNEPSPQKKSVATESEPKDSFAGFADTTPVKIPFDMPTIPTINFPDHTCTITDYGAVPDGKVMNTESFKAAITDCSAQGGGTVTVPSGIWLAGPIRLESHVNLHLEEGAKILFSDNFSDYLPVVFTRFEGIELYNYSPLIYAKDCSSVAITGKGELDGNGGAWLKWNDLTVGGGSGDSNMPLKKVSTNKLYEMAAKGVPVEKRIFGTERAALQPAFIQFVGCHDVLVEGVEITNSPSWTLHPVYSDNITVRDVYINTSKRNTDGIVIDSSSNVVIEHSTLNTGDDAVVIKSGKDQDGWRVGKPSENIIIHDLTIEDGNSGIAIGSEMSGDIRNVLAYNIKMQVVDFGIRFKSMPGRGGIVENIWIENVFMRRANYGAIHMDLGYGTPIVGYQKNKAPVFRDISIKNVECRRTKDAIVLAGLPESPLTNISLENILILSSQGAAFENVQSKSLKDVKITVKGKPTPVE